MPNPAKTLKLGGLSIEVPDSAKTLAKLVADGTTFAEVQVFPSALIQPLALKGQDTVSLNDSRFTLGGSADAELAIAVFNEASGPDPDQILKPTAGRAWSKHQLAADVQGTFGGTAGGVGFGLQGELGARLLQYRVHAPGEPVGPALFADITDFLLAPRLADIGKLREGEVLVCTFHGKLALHAKLTWADALSAALSALDERLGAVGVSAIQIDLGASVAVNLAIEDDYRLLFRPGSQAPAVRVEIRRTRGRTLGVSAGFNLEASIAHPAELQRALDAYVQARLGPSWAQVQKLIQRLDTAQTSADLNAEERALAEKIGHRLGLADLDQGWKALKARLAQLPADLTHRLEKAVNTQVKAEVAAEYSRIATEEVVLACELAPAALARHHGEMLAGNWTELLAHLAAKDPGYELIEYLKTDTLTRRLSFGISLSLGKWAASGKDEVVREWKRQTDLNEQHERRSFAGRRTYAAVWGGQSFHYAFGLGAAMERFSSGRTADAGEFDYSLSFGWNWKAPLTPTLLAEALDLAHLWSILPQEENEADPTAVLAAASGPALIEVEQKVSDRGLRALLAVPPEAFEAAWIEAMAAALPRVHISSKVFRGGPRDRVAVYGKAAAFAFEQSGGADISAIAGRVQYAPNDPNTLVLLRRIDQGEIAAGIFPDLGLKVLWTANTSGTRPSGRCHRAKAALAGLAAAIDGKLPPAAIERTFDEIQALLTRPYECRLLGRVVAALVASRTPGEVIRTMRVTPDSGNAILIGSRPS
ncbi:MAG: hypothetical protein QOJ16_166 [Acidobacteriota bacterium]|nr:hypothetical protein [Acidobacteriota bacterium]